MKKRILVAVLVLVMGFSLVACGDGDATDDNAVGSTPDSGVSDTELTQDVINHKDFDWPFGSSDTWITGNVGSSNKLFEDYNLLIIDLVTHTDESPTAIYVSFGEYDIGVDTLNGDNITTIYTSDVSFTDEGFSLSYEGVQIQAVFEANDEEGVTYLKGTLSVDGLSPYDFSIRDSRNKTEGCEECRYTGFINDELCSECGGRGHKSIIDQGNDRFLV